MGVWMAVLCCRVGEWVCGWLYYVVGWVNGSEDGCTML